MQGTFFHATLDFECVWAHIFFYCFAFFGRISRIEDSQRGLFHFAYFPKEGQATFLPRFMILSVHVCSHSQITFSWSALPFTVLDWTFLKFQSNGNPWLIKPLLAQWLCVSVRLYSGVCVCNRSSLCLGWNGFDLVAIKQLQRKVREQSEAAKELTN